MDEKHNLTGLHLLLTYKCTFECDHCFVWGSPWQVGTMTFDNVREIIDQASYVDSIEWIYFEGGEPFLYYPILMLGIDYAKAHNFKVGIVSNGYWANSLSDALLWLDPLKGKVDDLSISSDLFHFSEKTSRESQNILEACEVLNIPVGVISISRPDKGDGGLMFRGRASDKLAGQYENKKIEYLNECPYEELSNPQRFHVDPFGNVHICQGIIAGNLFQKPLNEIISIYDPSSHPIISPLVEGGPLRLAEQFDIACRSLYADACQLCYETRIAIRARGNDYLQPDQIYGIYE